MFFELVNRATHEKYLVEGEDVASKWDKKSVKQ
jgi:hypothetical protein